MKKDKLLFITIILLCLFGLLMVYSSSNIWSQYKFNNKYHYLIYQSIFFIIGLILMIIISHINIKYYYKYSSHILIFTIILLVLVLIPGIGTIRNGSRSWFGIGPLGLQPSEASKISLIIFTSKYLSNNKKLFPLLLVVGVVFSLIMLQPDLGTDLVLALSVLSIIFISGVDLKLFKIGGLLGLIGVVILIVIAPYRMDRITSFINPWKDELGTGFQIIQSMYAIGPFGLMGAGYLNSVQKHFYLPEPQTDFIFSIICEEFGVVGSIIVVGLFIILFYRGVVISLRQKDKFSKYLSFGILFQLVFQATLNMSIITGLLPVTGITLPFISYGGSSLLISMISMGILLSISRIN